MHVDPAALGDHACHRSIGGSSRGLRDGCDVEHLAAADRLVAARLAQHVPVAGQQRHGDGQEHAHRTARTRSDRVAAQHAHPHGDLARAEVREVRAAPGDVVVERRQHVEGRVEAIGRPPASGRHHGVAAADLVVADPGEVERDAVARPDRGHRRAERLDASHPSRAGARLDHDGVALVQLAARQGAGHDRAAALRRERAVDPEAWPPTVGGARRRGEQFVERAAQLVEPDAGGGGDGHDRCTVEEGAGDTIRDVELGDLAPLVVDQVDLGERDHAVADAEHLEDPEVLLGLRFPPLGGGDDEEAGVDRTDPGEHVAQEPHVARHVDEAEHAHPKAVWCARTRGRSSARAASPPRTGRGRSPSAPGPATTSRDRRAPPSPPPPNA